MFIRDSSFGIVLLCTVVAICNAKPQQRMAEGRYSDNNSWEYLAYSIKDVPGLRDVKPVAVIPHEVRRLIKRNVHSCYFGSTPSQLYSPPIYVHIYYMEEKSRSKSRQCVLDLYEQKITTNRKGKKLKQLVCISNFVLPPLNKDRKIETLYVNKYLDIQSFWLDPKTKRIPTLKIDSYEYESGGGDTIILKFMHGWRIAPSVEEFYYGYALASNMMGYVCSFEGIGEDGLLKFQQAELSTGQ